MVALMTEDVWLRMPALPLEYQGRDLAIVITVEGDRISAITRFENSVIPRFGLPRTLPDES